MLFQNTLDFDPGAASAVAGTPPGIDLAVAKYRPDGAISWVKTVSTLAPNAGALVVPHGVQTDATGNVYVIGYFGFLGTNAAVVSADFDPGPGAVTLTNTGGADPFVAKLDPSGNLLWARTFGSSTASNTEERGWDLAVDASGSVYVAGFLNGTYDLDASPSSSQLYTSAGAKDAFLVKYDAAGNFVWGFGLGTAGDEEGLSVDVDDAGSVFFQGYFNNTLDLDPGASDTFTYAWTASKDGSPHASGTEATFAFLPGAAGIYEVGLIVGDDDGGTGVDTCSIAVTAADVVGRHIFYNNSTFDGHDATASKQDDNAIAPTPAVRGHGHSAEWDEPEKELGKQALLPGQTATFVNYTSYLLGINGLMVDLAHPLDPQSLDASDFEFRVGNDNAPAVWRGAPAPVGIAVREVDENGDGV